MYAIGISVFLDQINGKHASRITTELKRLCDQLNDDNISYPPSLTDIIQFEKDNEDISINILEYGGFDKNDKIILYDGRTSPHTYKRKHLVELLIIKDKIRDEITDEIIERKHYTTIMNIYALFRNSKSDNKFEYCRKCYTEFENHTYLDIHIPTCTGKSILPRMPEKGKNDIIEFRDFRMLTMMPHMLIGDFETHTDESGEIKSYSFALLTQCMFNKTKNKLSYYTGNNCLEEFFDTSEEQVKEIDETSTQTDRHSNRDVYKCIKPNPTYLICNKIIRTSNPKAFRYYDKKTGYLLGFKHNRCIYKNNELAILFHNGGKFDFRLIITYLSERYKDSNINPITKSLETSVTFTIPKFAKTNIKLRFIDS